MLPDLLVQDCPIGEHAAELPEDGGAQSAAATAVCGHQLEGDLLAGLHGLQDWRESFVNRAYIEPLIADPQDHHRRMALAKTRMEAEQFNDAISTLVPLLNTGMKGEALFMIGYGYAKQKEYQKAVGYMQQAVQIEPESTAYQGMLEAIQARRN